MVFSFSFLSAIRRSLYFGDQAADNTAPYELQNRRAQKIMRQNPSHPCSCLSLLRVDLSAGLDALKQALTVLVDLELGDLDLAGVDADRDGLAVGLLAGDALYVDDILQAVDGDDLALTALVGATGDDDLVVFSYGDCANLRLC